MNKLFDFGNRYAKEGGGHGLEADSTIIDTKMEDSGIIAVTAITLNRERIKEKRICIKPKGILPRSWR